MRLLFACTILFLAAALVPAQTAGAASLESLNFLLGIWTADDPRQQADTTEFHWAEQQGNKILVGRHWVGDENGCPWCVTQAAIVAYYDEASNQVQVSFRDKIQRALDFRLVSAREKSIQFLSDAESELAVYRLTFTLSATNVLLITLEQAESDGQNAFFTTARWSLHRRSLPGPAS
jgi:hypothetical protein